MHLLFQKKINCMSFVRRDAACSQFMPKVCTTGRKGQYSDLDKGPSINDVRFFCPLFDLPTYPCPIFYYYKLPILLYGVQFWQQYLPTPKSDIIYGCPLTGFKTFSLIHEENLRILKKGGSFGVVSSTASSVFYLILNY